MGCVVCARRAHTTQTLSAIEYLQLTSDCYSFMKLNSTSEHTYLYLSMHDYNLLDLNQIPKILLIPQNSLKNNRSVPVG